MKFAWNETKRIANLKKHGLDFVDAGQVFAGITRTFEDSRFAYGEQRFITLITIRSATGRSRGHFPFRNRNRTARDLDAQGHPK